MILTVTLNAALDVTYTVDELRPHASNRVRAVATRAGGKGVNVARVLHTLGHDVVATGLCGGAAGAQIRDELAVAGVAADFAVVGGESRRTVTVVDGDATVLLEPGPHVTAQEFAAFQSRFAELLTDARAVVLSGSLPPGLPSDAYATLGRLAAGAGVPVLLDAADDALVRGLEAAPAVVKPNAAELAGVTAVGAGVSRERDVPAVRLRERHTDAVAGAVELQRRGARAVVVSCGPDGLVAIDGREAWWAAPPELLPGNPTGAGDAVVAALAVGLVERRPWPERLADAVALSAAAVVAPLAGEVDLGTYQRLRSSVRVQQADVREGAPCR